MNYKSMSITITPRSACIEVVGIERWE